MADLEEARAKYDADQLKELQAKGQTFPGGTSYPIADVDDLDSAIKAVGRGNADHDAIRKYIMARAADLKESALIPDNWQSDGSLAEEKSADLGADAASVKALQDQQVTNERMADRISNEVAKAIGSLGLKVTGDDKGFAQLVKAQIQANSKALRDAKGDECPTCDGTGTIMDGNRECPDCDGSGEMLSAKPVVAARSKKRRHRSGPPLGREFRRFAAEGLEVRSGSNSDSILITGMPIVYNTPYSVRDMFGTFEETMLPGVASDVISRGADVRFLFNHDGLPLARTTSGTLTLDTNNTRGLPMTATLDSRQQLANDLAVAIERGDVNQMSCGFVVGTDDWNDAGDQRSISKFSDMFDVSAVTYPASPTTSIELAYRSLLAQPVESQARTRQLWVTVGKNLRAGQPLSAETTADLQTALDALHSVDDVDLPGIVRNLQAVDAALDSGQSALAGVLGVKDPDGDPEDLEPALDPPIDERSAEPADLTAIQLEAEQLRLRGKKRRHAA